jgi:hypothetical protein
MEHGDALFIPGAFWHFNRYLEPGFSLSLRALPNKPDVFANMLYHVFIMRYTDKIMRKLFKAKWVNYKQKWAYKKAQKHWKSICIKGINLIRWKSFLAKNQFKPFVKNINSYI